MEIIFMSLVVLQNTPAPNIIDSVKLSLWNSKLAKDGIASFNIPALKDASGFVTCPNAGICAGLCYARQGRFTMAMVQAPREANVALLKACHHANDYEPFIEAACKGLAALPRKFKRVRIHDSGDFFSHSYFQAWIEIAEAHPHIAFYAYTKMISMLRQYPDLPANLHIIQSVGGLEDDLIDMSRPHSRIFTSDAACKAAGYINASKSDRPAYEGETRIGLVYHGSRKLTQRQGEILDNA